MHPPKLLFIFFNVRGLRDILQFACNVIFELAMSVTATTTSEREKKCYVNEKMHIEKALRFRIFP